ncbi:MAG: cob(I)yrinic acid a,c-diamide adenosyltransferase [Elusimicrobia bacterium]|nr:cob(I)yrinic acid a,c-diamide adenosyltransferase [Elusimicrobiota bacterium]
MKIYTRTGDKGETGLWGGERVPKTHPRVAAYGDVDELNTCLGWTLSLLGKDKRLSPLRKYLSLIQEELFIVGALLATPEARRGRLSPPFDKGLPPDASARLEAEIDAMTASLKPLKSFILPGGSPAGASLHFARAVCRRAERSAVALSHSDRLPEGLIVYLNRLSDHLFTAARWANARAKSVETPWAGLARK